MLLKCQRLSLLSLAIAVTAVSPAVPAADGVAAPPEAEHMTSLFNGKDLTGWDGDSRLWSVKDGVIHGETTEENKANGNTFLICKQVETKDFELRLSFRASASNN
ncbi:MAG: DUF1080 domain-containing protein, partial [Planctomycetaceae bacterium]|nr:DUF1080 domain-containing protein [Planctomycetaceae bacterium]